MPIPAPPATQPTSENGEEEKEDQLVSQDIHLESHELFSQLCTRANLVKSSPQRGLFHSCVSVGEGILRVWRDWLAEQAKLSETGDKLVVGKGDVLWADSKRTVGLRVKVQEREALPIGPPLRAGEERDVSYTLYYEGMFSRLCFLPWGGEGEFGGCMMRLIKNRVTCQNDEVTAHR